MQQVAYDLLLYQQRQQLHHAVAKWYETLLRRQPGPALPVPGPSLATRGRAGQGRRLSGEGGRAVAPQRRLQRSGRLLQPMLALHAESDLFKSDFRRACWQRQLGEAEPGAGQAHRKPRRPAARARTAGVWRARDVGPSARRARAACRASILAAHAAPLAPAVRPPTPLADADGEAALAYERLAEIYYLCGEQGPRHSRAALRAQLCGERRPLARRWPAPMPPMRPPPTLSGCRASPAPIAAMPC